MQIQKVCIGGNMFESGRELDLKVEHNEIADTKQIKEKR